jgi:membrane protease YdiL (CAAX protease family)
MSNDSSEPNPEVAAKQQPTTIFSKVPWSPGAAIIYAVVVYFVAQLLASLIIVIYPHLRRWNHARGESWLTNTVTAQFWYVLFAEALTFGAIWWFIRRRKASLRAIGWRKPALWDPLYALAGFAAYFVGYVVLLTIVTHIFPSLNVNQKQQLGFTNASGTVNLWLTFISLVVLPPLAEETVFRGFVFTGLRTKLKPVVAALLTSALFATAHLEFGSGQPLLWVAALDTFTLSLVLCYLRYKTDSLWPGIFLHGLKNGIAFVSLFLIHAH